MTSHDLARLLLAQPDLPIATKTHDRAFIPYGTDEVKVGIIDHHYGPHILIGKITRQDFTKSIWTNNWYVTSMIAGEDPR